MRYNKFGATELQVSEIGIGLARIGGVFQSVTTAEAMRTLSEAMDAGVNFFDTSDMYTQGESEKLLGRAARGRREQVVLATKVGYCLPARRKLVSRIKPLVRPIIQRLGIKRSSLPTGASGALTQDFSPDYILRAAEASLTRLGTDHIDFYQLHSPPQDVLEAGEFIAPLEKLQRDGKIRYFGVSCERAEDALICLRYPSISALQLPLNLLEQSAADEAIPAARERGVCVVARQCYAGGFLARPMDALGLEVIDDPVRREEVRNTILDYNTKAERAQRILREMALEYVIGVKGVSVTIVGIHTHAQFQELLSDMANMPVSDSVLDS